jgi:hypothetical protein
MLVETIQQRPRARQPGYWGQIGPDLKGFGSEVSGLDGGDQLTKSARGVVRTTEVTSFLPFRVRPFRGALSSGSNSK